MFQGFRGCEAPFRIICEYLGEKIKAVRCESAVHIPLLQTGDDSVGKRREHVRVGPSLSDPSCVIRHGGQLGPFLRCGRAKDIHNFTQLVSGCEFKIRTFEAACVHLFALMVELLLL